MNRLLKHQMMRHLGSLDSKPVDVSKMMDYINKTYRKMNAKCRELKRSLDLSSQKLLQMNSELEVMFQAFPDLLFRTDQCGVILNYQSSIMPGTPLLKESIIGNNICNLLTENLRDTFRDALTQIKITRSFIIKEYSIAGKDKNFFYEARFSPLLKDQVAIIIRDITDRKWDEEKLIRHQKNLEKMVDERTVELRKINEKLQHEITERKKYEMIVHESEEKYRELIEKDDAAIFITQQLKVVFYNSALIKLIFGSKECVKDLLGINMMKYIHPDEQHKLMEIYQKRLAGQWMGNMYVQIRIINELKNELWVQVCTAPTTWQGHLAAINFVRDVTKEINIERQLQQTQKMEIVGNIAGGIAHDFNNILSVIMTHTEKAIKNVSKHDHKLRNDLDMVYEAGERATDLVKQILTFSRRSTDEEKYPLKITPLIKGSLRLIRASLPSTIEVQHEFKTSNDVVMANPTHIHQILFNLCTNAADAMAGAKGILRISLSSKNVMQKSPLTTYHNMSPGIYLKLTVSDTGSGIDPKISDHIFDPYFTTKEPGKGTGMGLFVVHGIVKKYGGAVTYESLLGKGASFNVYLPVADMKPIKLKEKISGNLKGKERILLVDDDEALISAGKVILRDLGYSVTGTTNSMKALKLFIMNPERYDLVITDLIMPRLTGTELAQKITHIRPDIPVIVWTASGDHGISQEVQASIGIKDIILKPITQHNVATVVRRTLDAQHLSDM
jgi:PAS domain S-box-containing protein